MFYFHLLRINHMKKILLISFILFSPVVFSQETIPALDSELPTTENEETIEPVISTKDFVKVGEEVMFDGAGSKILSVSDNGLPSYSWVVFKNGESIDTKFTKSIVYSFEDSGVYNLKLNVKQGSRKKSVEKNIVVYETKATFITDKDTDFSEIDIPASKQGIWLKKITLDKSATEFSSEEDFIYKFQENLDFIKESSFFIFASDSNLGLSSFSRFWQKLSPDNVFTFEDKTLVRITENKLDKELKLIQPVFETLGKPMLLAHKEVLPSVFTKQNFDNLINEIENKGYDYRLVDEKSRPSTLLPLKNLIGYFSKNGVATSIIYLLLSVPFLAFIVAFARQFIGISTYGVFAPLMLSLSFMVLGLKFGLSVFVTILFLSYIIRKFFEKVELLYIPRLALLMSILSLSFLFILAIGVRMGTSLNLALAIFPMMVMSTISEKFISAQTKEGLRNAIIVAIETIFVALLAYAFVEWNFIKEMIFATPEFILLPIIGNVLLGKFTGLRLSEYLRFGSLLSDDTEE